MTDHADVERATVSRWTHGIKVETLRAEFSAEFGHRGAPAPIPACQRQQPPWSATAEGWVSTQEWFEGKSLTLRTDEAPMTKQRHLRQGDRLDDATIAIRGGRLEPDGMVSGCSQLAA